MKDYQITPTGRDDAIRRLYNTGEWSMEKIAHLFDLTRARVHQIIRKKTTGDKVLDIKEKEEYTRDIQ